MAEMVSKTLKQVADFIQGTIDETIKSSDLIISTLATSPATSTEGDLTIVFDQKYVKELPQIKAKAIILPANLKGKIPSVSVPVIWIERPRLVLKKLTELFAKPVYLPQPGIHPKANIDSTAKVALSSSVGANVFIGPGCVIGENVKIFPNVFISSNVTIGDNCTIYANVSIYDYTKIGCRVIIHSGSVIGSDGYSYVTEEESNLEKAKKGNFNFNLGRQVQHKTTSIGNVVIEDDVEIGSNTSVDRGTIGTTVIGAGTKVDNLVQIAHNCKIGKDCLVVGQVGLAGSVNIGDRVVVGGQAGFADNINIGSDVIFVARSAVHGNIPSNSVYMGMPAVPYMDYFKNEKAMKRLPRKQEKLEEQVKELEEKIKQLENKLDTSLRGAKETLHATSPRQSH